MKNFTKENYIKEIQRISNEGRTIEITNKDQKKAYMNANLIDLDFDTPIYRIFKIDDLISTLKEKKLCLVKPELWEDPFENFLLNSTGILNDGTLVSFKEMRKSYYGQCWSLKEECDGLWRNYTANSCKKCTSCDFAKRHGKYPISAKVKTTVGKIMDAFYDETEKFHSLSYYIGKVRYCETDEIIEYLKNAANIHITDPTNIDQVLSLLVKRSSFSYEEEVRLIFSSPNNDTEVKRKSPCNNFVKFQIDPNLLFDEIELNPWIDNNSCSAVITNIKQYYNGNVIQSKLYEKIFFQINL